MSRTEGATALSRTLAAATCALLSAPQVHADAWEYVDKGLNWAEDWNVDSALAYYHEDGRIQAVEPVVSVNKTFANESLLDLTGVFDTLSGSTPNGALTSNRPQTFTSPSGKSFTGRHVYTTAPGTLPVDSNYSDQRVAFTGSWQFPWNRATRATVGGKFSYEDDFDSVTANAGIERDFFDKNTTLSFSAYDEFDSISPIGGTPAAGSDYSAFDKHGGVTKNGVGALLGVVQIMNRAWLSEFNLSIDRFKGYLNDPYKIVSVIGSDGTTSGYQYESRPDERVRKSAFLENRVAGDRWSSGLTLRYMSDDWHIRSETATLNAHWWMSNKARYLEPSIRWYRQGAAYFYSPYIDDTPQAMAARYASSDSRLSRFTAMTYGIKYGQQFSGRSDRAPSELSIRLEYYRQSIDNQFATPDSLKGLNLYPSLNAIFMQIGWRF